MSDDSEELICLDGHSTTENCVGKVVLRDALSGTGKMFPRCDFHWSERVERQQEINERYPEQPPSDWSHWDAGEYWSEEDY